MSSSQLLQLSNGLINAGMKEKMGDLLGEFKELDAWKKQMQEEIDIAKNLLDESPILAPIILWGESPDQFYSRTVHSGNIGATGIRALYATTDISLLLPTVNTSLGGPQYVYQ